MMGELEENSEEILSVALLSPACLVILVCFFLGSFEMNKLRLAIMGKKGKNLDDLSQMDGE